MLFIEWTLSNDMRYLEYIWEIYKFMQNKSNLYLNEANKLSNKGKELI